MSSKSVEVSDSSPWHLTVVRIQGFATRSDKLWRLAVSITPLNHHKSCSEVILGRNGQNPNLKLPLILHNVDNDTRLDIKIWHRSNIRNRKKCNLIGYTSLSLRDVLELQHQSGGDSVIHLSLPPTQRRNVVPAKGPRPVLILRVRKPTSSSIFSISEAWSGINRALSFQHDDNSSDDSSSDVDLSQPSTSSASTVDLSTTQAIAKSGRLRRRRKMKALQIDTDEDQKSFSESNLDLQYDIEIDAYLNEWFPSRSFLPQNVDEAVVVTVMPAEPSTISWIHAIDNHMQNLISRVSPLRQLQQATQDEEYERILAPIVAEWYSIGSWLLGLGALNTAAFGFEPDSLFTVSNAAKGSVTLGVIASAIGTLIDAWFLLIYSTANGAQFKSRAADRLGDAQYFFFCFTCHLPMLCAFFSAGALAAFVLFVAWDAWATAVLVMCFVVGILLGLQYLVLVLQFVARAFWYVTELVVVACTARERLIAAILACLHDPSTHEDSVNT